MVFYFSEAHDTAERLKREKSSGSYKKKLALMDQTIDQAFNEWIPYLYEKAYRETTENTTHFVSVHNKARSLIRYYTPEEIK